MNKHSAPHFCSIVADYRLYLKWGRGGFRGLTALAGRRLWPPGGGRLCRKVATKRFLGLTDLWPEGCGIAIGHAYGVRVQRFHKVQRVQRVQRGWYRRFAAMSFIAAYRRQRCQRQRKPNNRACGALEMHPFCRLRRRLPRRGRFALHSASGLISISRHSAAKTYPSGVAKELDL